MKRNDSERKRRTEKQIERERKYERGEETKGRWNTLD